MSRTFGSLQKELESFLTAHLSNLENDERIEALTWYCQGIGLELPQKSVFGIGSRLDPGNVEARRQRIQRALQKGRFTHHNVFSRLQETVSRQGDKFEAYAIDDTGIAKKGESSAGVQRQYSGTLGKIDNCQIIVTMHAISDDFGLCLDAQLYLPESWTEDEAKLKKVGVPSKESDFRSKPEIALDQLEAAIGHGMPKRPVVADAGYGDSRDFRDGLTKLGLVYGVGISSNTTVWPPGSRPEVPPRTGKSGRPFTQDRDKNGKKPVRVDQLAHQYWSDGKFRTVLWRKGSTGRMRGQFYAVRVRSAERRTKKKRASDPIWLVMEREVSADESFKYYLCSLPRSASIKEVVRLVKMRWHIERDYQDMKQKLGFDRYEGRSWGGLHRHLAMVSLLHAFLSLHREAFSPGEPSEPVDVGGLSPCPCCGAYALVGELSHLSQEVQ